MTETPEPQPMAPPSPAPMPGPTAPEEEGEKYDGGPIPEVAPEEKEEEVG
jgi:hypothetical protein